MRKVFKNTLFKKGEIIQKLRLALYFAECQIFDFDMGRNKSMNGIWFELRIFGIGIDIDRNENKFHFHNIYNRYWCK